MEDERVQAEGTFPFRQLAHEDDSRFLSMLKELPRAYEAGSAQIWDTEPMASQLLLEHLDPHGDGGSRPHAFVDRSVDWICQAVEGGRGKALLDLGCGPGLYAERFAERGFQVTGIDFSRRSLDYAREQARKKALPIRYLCQDYLDWSEEEAYDLILLLYCDLGALAPENRQSLLANVHRALKKGGLFVVDGFSPRFSEGFEEGVELTREEGGFWSEQPYLEICRKAFYADQQTLLEQYLVVTGKQCQTYLVWNQIFTGQTLKSLLEEAGFRQVDLYDDVAGKPYRQKEETVAALACK